MIGAAGAASTLELLAYAPPGWGATLLAGLWNSVLIALGAYALGILIGIFGAYGKLYGGPVTRDLLAVYTTVVRAVPVIEVIPDRQCRTASIRCGVRTAIGPLAQCRLDEPLGLAVCLWSIDSGEFVADAQIIAGVAKGV